MIIRNSKSLAITLVAFTIGACQLTSACAVGSNSESQIVSSTSTKEKGIPFGRSDSTAPFFRLMKLQNTNDPDYGYSQYEPIRIGPISARGAHILYLNSLRGPKGEAVEYERKGACCEFEDKSLPMGGGVLDVYKIKVDGSGSVITLYVDMYRIGPPQLPVGFTARKE